MPSCAIWRSSISTPAWSGTRHMTQYIYLKRNHRNWKSQHLTVTLVSLFVFLLDVTPALANQQAPSAGSGSVLNILLLGLIAYFLVRAFRRRSGGDNDQTKPGNWTEKRPDDKKEGRVLRPMDRHEAARQMWGHLSSDKNGADSTPPVVTAESGAFNEAEFLEGAKLFFSRFQEATDSREFDDLRGFLSDEVYADAVAQAQGNPAQARSEIMLLNARLMELKTESGHTAATVFYDAQIRKGVSGEQPVHVRVVWEFSRNDSIDNALWTLEKINKVDQ